MRLHGSPVAHGIAFAIACSACSGGDRPAPGPPPAPPTLDADRPVSTADGPRSIPARAGDRPCADQTMVTVTLDDGRRVAMSPLHPTADGGVFAGAFTHDILPDSDTGTYVTAGALVGSTLFQP